MPIMNPQREKLKIEVEKVLQTIEPKLAASIRSILHANLDRGRVETFVGADFSRVDQYVKRVADQYTKLSPYIFATQKNMADDVWQPLFKKLQAWAYNFLLMKNFFPGSETQAIADECAANAAMHILNAHFPYDTEFEPWAYTIVTMSCLRFFRDGTKKSIIPPQNLVELDEQLPALDITNLIERDDQNDLLTVLSELSEARRQVIQLHYFEAMSLPEIAEVMKKSVGAIYCLHFNALEDLRKILGKNRNNT